MGEAVRALFFPALLTGVVCCVLWAHLPNRNGRLWLFLVGVGLFAVPQFVVVMVGTAATELILHRQVVLAIWLSGFGAFAAWRVVRILRGRPLPTYNPARSQRINSPVILSIIALAFGGFGLYTAEVTAQDFLAPHLIYEGHITRKWVEHGTRSAPQFYVALDGQSVQVGQDLYRALRSGEVVRAEITGGSHTVLRVYRDVSVP